MRFVTTLILCYAEVSSCDDRDMIDRSILLATAAATAAIGLASPAGADPHCQPGPCTHGTAQAPAPATSHGPSYQDGYKTEHDYFSSPQNHAYLASEMKQGYTAESACQVELGGGAPPANVADWLAGCTDALHDLGFTP